MGVVRTAGLTDGERGEGHDVGRQLVLYGREAGVGVAAAEQHDDEAPVAEVRAQLLVTAFRGEQPFALTSAWADERINRMGV